MDFITEINNMYQDLTAKDKLIFNKLVKRFNLNCFNLKEDYETEYKNHVNILLGEMESGNDNPQIKEQLKTLIKLGLSENLISKKRANDIFIECL
jgi:hypothetical protein